MPKINLIVNVRHEKDGGAFPVREDGRIFGIDPILDVWKAASLKAGFKYSLHLSQLRKNCNVIKCRWLVVPGEIVSAIFIFLNYRYFLRQHKYDALRFVCFMQKSNFIVNL